MCDLKTGTCPCPEGIQVITGISKNRIMFHEIYYTLNSDFIKLFFIIQIIIKNS
jgi:hypothetical protein